MLSMVVLFGALCVLEYLFWLTPVKQVIERFSLRGIAYYMFPVHYWIRILVAFAVVLGFKPSLHYPFAGLMSWVYSLLLGFVICLVSLAVFRLPLSRMLNAVHSSSSTRFWIHSAYILVYPSLIEELLFRWLLVWMLLPSVGWWVVLLAPTINILWHLPVWIHSFKVDGKIRWGGMFLVSIQAYVFAVILTGIYVLTQNLMGVIVAHAFGDWVSIAMQYRTAKVRQQHVGEGSTYQG